MNSGDTMVNAYVIGGQTGDEGKGKIVDALIHSLKIMHVVRFNGGNNAGHTLVFTPKQFSHLKGEVVVATHLVPSGIAYQSVQLHLARGMVIDFEQLNYEVLEIREKTGIDVTSRLNIDRTAMLVLPQHRLLDLAEDLYKKRKFGESSGTTGRGIGPAYSSETGRFEINPFLFEGDLSRFESEVEEISYRIYERIRHEFQCCVDDFKNLFEEITKKEERAKKYLLERQIIPKNEISYKRFFKKYDFNTTAIAEAYWKYGQNFKGNLCDVMENLETALSKGEPILFEGAQGSNLDKRWGQQPNVTSSHTLSTEIPLSAEIHLEEIDLRALVFKAYSTKVGTHVYVTEMQEGESTATLPDGTKEDLSERLRKIEFGATTGRQRMVGWFDLVEARRYVRLNDANELIITKLDMLTGADKIKVCTRYLDSRYIDNDTQVMYDELPNNNDLLKWMQPVYAEFQGWKEDISGCKTFNELPENAKKYLKFIELDLQQHSRTNPKLYIISTGSRREQQFFVG